MARFVPRALSPAEQTAADAEAERVLAHLKRLLGPDAPVDRVAHEAWVAAQQADGRHSEGCDCGECVDGPVCPSP